MFPAFFEGTKKRELSYAHMMMNLSINKNRNSLILFTSGRYKVGMPRKGRGSASEGLKGCSN